MVVEGLDEPETWIEQVLQFNPVDEGDEGSGLLGDLFVVQRAHLAPVASKRQVSAHLAKDPVISASHEGASRMSLSRRLRGHREEERKQPAVLLVVLHSRPELSHVVEALGAEVLEGLHLLVPALEDCVQQIVLAGEMAVDRRGGYTDPVGDLAQRPSVVARSTEGSECFVDDLSPPGDAGAVGPSGTTIFAHEHPSCQTLAET